MAVCMGWGSSARQKSSTFSFASGSSLGWQQSRAVLSPTLLLATALKFSLQLGGRWRAGGSTWRSSSGCSQQHHVRSVPDVLYHPPEMSPLSQACVSLCQLLTECHSAESSPCLITLLLHAQPQSHSPSPNACTPSIT